MGKQIVVRRARLARKSREKELIREYSSANCRGCGLIGDTTVDSVDLGLLLGAWGTCNSPCPSDLTSSNAVDGADLALLFGAWGACATNFAMMAGSSEGDEASGAWAAPLTPELLAEALGFSDVVDLAEHLGSLDFPTMQSLLAAYFGS